VNDTIPALVDAILTIATRPRRLTQAEFAELSDLDARLYALRQRQRIEMPADLPYLQAERLPGCGLSFSGDNGQGQTVGANDEWQHAMRCLSLAAEVPASPDADTIISHGEGRYSVGGSDPVTVTASENLVLQAFINRGTLNGSALKRLTGTPNYDNDDAPKVLRKLRTKYGKRFAPAITLPGSKGKGGYQVRIRPASQ
jgi:hypothetical protein